jgi:excinuclease ABC subunit A
MRVDGEVVEISRGMKVDRYKNHDIEVVIDKLSLPPAPSRRGGEERLKKSVEIAMKQGEGLIMILDVTNSPSTGGGRGEAYCPPRRFAQAGNQGQPARHD